MVPCVTLTHILVQLLLWAHTLELVPQLSENLITLEWAAALKQHWTEQLVKRAGQWRVIENILTASYTVEWKKRVRRRRWSTVCDPEGWRRKKKILTFFFSFHCDFWDNITTDSIRVLLKEQLESWTACWVFPPLLFSFLSLVDVFAACLTRPWSFVSCRASERMIRFDQNHCDCGGNFFFYLNSTLSRAVYVHSLCVCEHISIWCEEARVSLSLTATGKTCVAPLPQWADRGTAASAWSKRTLAAAFLSLTLHVPAREKGKKNKSELERRVTADCLLCVCVYNVLNVVSGNCRSNRRWVWGTVSGRLW